MNTLKKISWDSYKNLDDMFASTPGFINDLRHNFTGSEVAYEIKKQLTVRGILSGVLVFVNNDVTVKNSIKVFGKPYTCYAVVLIGNGIIDIFNSDKIFKTKEYIETLEKDNFELDLNKSLSTGWLTETGFTYIPTLQELKKL